ncbi:MAG: nucleoside deaminase [Bacteroidales bacterium]
MGEVMVRRGKIIAEAFNEVVLSGEPPSYAEIFVIKKASWAKGSLDLGDCILYSLCEPCPMCLGAIYWADIKKVYYVSDRRDATRARFKDNIIYDEIMRAPEERRIDFIKINNIDGSVIFDERNRFENRSSY